MRDSNSHKLGLIRYGFDSCKRVQPSASRSSMAMQCGFTLLELIMVLVLLGILSVAIFPNFAGISSVNVRGFHDETLAYLRYGQKTAIAQRHSVCVTFSSSSIALGVASVASSYVCSSNLAGPRGEAQAVVVAPSGVTYTVAPTNFVFDALGQAVDLNGAALAQQVIQVLGNQKSVTIEAVTGNIHE